MGNNNCMNCGKPLKDDELFCSRCGSKCQKANNNSNATTNNGFTMNNSKFFFCKNCGIRLDDDAAFCPMCGTPKIRSVENRSYSGERRSVFVGEVRKCPSCGAELSSFSAICTQCGHELNSVEVPESIKDFSRQLSILDDETAKYPNVKPWKQWSGGKKFWWVVLNIFTLCVPLFIYLFLSIGGFGRFGKLSPAEKKKETFINNYSFPNDRESVLEALFFIKSQVVILASEAKNGKTKKWIGIWENKAKQLISKSNILFKDDIIANKLYNDILSEEKRVKKSVLIKCLILISLAIICGLIILIPRINCIAGSCYSMYNSSSKYYTYNEKAVLPTISENATTDENQGIFCYPIRKYVGKNAASIGKKENEYLIEMYGRGKIRIVFITEDGKYINEPDEEKMKYVVVGQNIPEGTNLVEVCERYSDGDISSMVSYQNYDEIVLYVAPINDTSYKPNPVSILPTLDRHIYHIRDYKGRNVASVGKRKNEEDNERIDEYGNGKIIIELQSEDGSFVDVDDMNSLRRYVVTDQDIAVNTELVLSYETDSYGNEYENLIKSQNYERITLTVKILDDSIIKQQPTIPESSTSADQNNEIEHKDLKLDYTVLSNGKAEITGYKGEGNSITVYDNIDGHNVVGIGKSAFKDCKDLVSVSVLTDIEYVDDYAFCGCESISEISFSSITDRIGKHSFEKCTSLKYPLIWSNPKIIDEYAFAGCSSIDDVSIDSKTEEIKAHAFDGCENLEYAFIWNENTVVDKSAFENCPKLKN